MKAKCSRLDRTVLFAATALALLCGLASGQDPGDLTPAAHPPPAWLSDAQSTTGPVPPPDVWMGTPHVAGRGAVISGVPTYIWHNGCGPTAAGMVIGYWDTHGYGGLIPGDASAQTAEVDAAISSQGNWDDYCLPLDEPPDPPLPDKSEPPPGDEHPDDCMADFMETSQSYYDNYYGWSWFSHVDNAFRGYADWACEYYQATSYNRTWGGLTWANFRAEIDAGRPLVFLVDTNADGWTDHFVTVIGYDESGGTRYYACLNTWDHAIHWFEFAEMAQGQSWGIYGATFFTIEPVTPPCVDCDAPGPGHDGTTWDTAFLTIQAGVDAATPDGEVWVADGVYVENVVMGSGVQLYGGFLGAEEGGYEDSLSERRFKQHWTIIDGNESGSCVVMAPESRVDGFGLTSGSGTVIGDLGHGGGIYCANIGETGAIANNVLWLNATDYCGGGIYLVGSSPDVIQNLFFGNSSKYGGAIYCRDESTPSVVNNVFEGNEATSYGGAMRIYQSSPVLVCNTILDNWAGSGAGAIRCDYSSLRVSNNIVAWNSGGGIKCGTDVTPTLTCNDFWLNTPYDYDGCAPGTGDICADPEFADADWGDIHLTGGSPCRDTGDNSAPDLPATDWEGEDRIANSTVDMGADEYLAIYTEAPDPQPECDGPLFGASQTGFPAWVWFSIPLTPDCVAGSGCADPTTLLGFDCSGRLWYWDKYGKWPQVYKPPFQTWDLSVGDSYLLYLEAEAPNPAYHGLGPFIPWTFEFKLGREGWTWIGMPGLAERAGEDFMSSVKVRYPSNDGGIYRTAQGDYDATPGNWISWGWPYWITWRQGAETFTPYAPFGHNTCYPWIGYRVWVNVGTAVDEDDPDQVTLIWPPTGG